jgi:hypothetical protein
LPRSQRGSPFTLAEIAERLGDTKVVTAEHYLYALGDYAESIAERRRLADASTRARTSRILM